MPKRKNPHEASFMRVCGTPDRIRICDLVVHNRIISMTGGLDGIRDTTGLEVSVASLQSFDGVEPFDATLRKSPALELILPLITHFADGNKRIRAMMA